MKPTCSCSPGVSRGARSGQGGSAQGRRIHPAQLSARGDSREVDVSRRRTQGQNSGRALLGGEGGIVEENSRLSTNSHSKVEMGSDLVGDDLALLGSGFLQAEGSQSSTGSLAEALRRRGAEYDTTSKRGYKRTLPIDRRLVPLVCTVIRGATVFLGKSQLDGSAHLPSVPTERTPLPGEIITRAKYLYGDAFPMHIVPRSVMAKLANCQVPLDNRTTKFYFPLIDARIDEVTADALFQAGVRWFTLDGVRVRNSHELETIALSQDVSALLLLQLNTSLPVEKNLQSKFLGNALVAGWGSSALSSHSQGSGGLSSMQQSPAREQRRWGDNQQDSRIQLSAEEARSHG
ncbi:hypothetical protein CBR_g24403 [Chara braunii]|uniref:Uncharacterized protein n=1 Tax=Chara braunii TaxID=69332 RepID=A0A388JMN5_CHABU|nr:hypothetical protein CBR_g24403 [Chara braunii]|eukprot:GBG59057.1 hypothetical protein CBR_g24403 [Chara braunii]